MKNYPPRIKTCMCVYTEKKSAKKYKTKTNVCDLFFQTFHLALKIAQTEKSKINSNVLLFFFFYFFFLLVLHPVRMEIGLRFVRLHIICVLNTCEFFYSVTRVNYGVDVLCMV